MKKVKLSSKDTLHLAKLASLEMSENEVKKIGAQLTETLDYIQNLGELNTEKTTPTNHTVNLTNEYFEDGTKNERQLSEKETFQNTKVKKNSYFAVKKIL